MSTKKNNKNKIRNLLKEATIVGITIDLDFSAEINVPIKICCKSFPITITMIIGMNCFSIPTLAKISTKGFNAIRSMHTEVDIANMIDIETICLNVGQSLSATAFPKNRFMPIPISKLDETPKIIEKEPMAATIPMTSEFV